jgi:hypothetical protein
MNISYSPVAIRDVLRTGQKEVDDARARKEVDRRGLLRVGSLGHIAADGTNLGECKRIAHARWKGIEKDIEPDTKIMFRGGEGNEELVKQLLEAVPGDISVVQDAKCEHNTDKWNLQGHTDLLVHDKAYDTNLILELKLVCSANTAKRVAVDKTPDIKHIIQLASYMWMLGEPGILMYVSRSNYVPTFKPKEKMGPFYKFFYLSIKDDVVYWREEFDTKENKSEITITGIKRFCDEVVSYCQFANTCNNYTTYERWMEKLL